jgi:hypothetical protein
MTEAKTFKRRVRERMSKTGESYTTARVQVAQKRDRNNAARTRLATEDERPPVEKLVEATGKTWDEWFAILDRWGATERTHRDIAKHLIEELGAPGWWAQSITYWYERGRGMRLKHQQADGFSVTATRTVGVPVEDLYEAFVDEVERKKWFEDASMSLRTETAKAPRGARFDWEDGSTRVVAWFIEKGPDKSTISLAHEKLPDADEAETMKALWRRKLSELKSHLESGPRD